MSPILAAILLSIIPVTVFTIGCIIMYCIYDCRKN